MRWMQNRAGFANAFPAPEPDIIFVPGRPGNPAGGSYWTVKYVVLNEVHITTMYFAKDPTEAELAEFQNNLLKLAEQQHWFTGEQDYAVQAQMAYDQYVQWVLKQRTP